MLADVDLLVGTSEIAGMLGVSRARTFQITSAPGFPPPVQELKMGKIWRLKDVQAWAKRTGRQLRDIDL